MLIYLSEYIHPDAVRLIRQRAEITDSFDRIQDVDGIILRTVHIGRDIMSRAVNLKVIGKHGVGCNTIDLAAAKELGIPVINTPFANTNSVAELIVGLMLDISRNISACDKRSRGEGFPCIAPPEMTGIELTGKTVGLVGMGNICLLYTSFALYVRAPQELWPIPKGYAHVFSNLYAKMPVLYALLLSLWKGLLGVLTMTFGFVLALYGSNVFIILTGPFIYVILENFFWAILDAPGLRFVTAFEPASLSAPAVHATSFIAGPALMCIVMGLVAFYYQKVKKRSIYQV